MRPLNQGSCGFRQIPPVIKLGPQVGESTLWVIPAASGRSQCAESREDQDELPLSLQKEIGVLVAGLGILRVQPHRNCVVYELCLELLEAFSLGPASFSGR